MSGTATGATGVPAAPVTPGPVTPGPGPVVPEGIISTVMNSINQLTGLIPDSILFGSILLYFVTQNYSYGIFSVFIFEMVLSHKLLSWIFAKVSGNKPTDADLKCYSGYKSSRYKIDETFYVNKYPPYGIFSITAIGTYLGLATGEFSSTLKEMEKASTGSDWTSRSIVANVLITCVIILFAISRYMTCDKSVWDIFVALLTAVIIGSMFFYINRELFGKEAMNFLGLPYIESKSSKGSPIYVCATETANK